MDYTDPRTVLSPRNRWTLIDVLDDGGGEGRASVALGRWKQGDGREQPELAIRWNGDKENVLGNPQSRGLPTWFIVPNKYREAIRRTLESDPHFSENKKAVLRNFFPD